MQLAEDMGMNVERRPVPEEEWLTFEEAGACGTAAVISPCLLYTSDCGAYNSWIYHRKRNIPMKY